MTKVMRCVMLTWCSTALVAVLAQFQSNGAVVHGRQMQPNSSRLQHRSSANSTLLQQKLLQDYLQRKLKTLARPRCQHLRARLVQGQAGRGAEIQAA